MHTPTLVISNPPHDGGDAPLAGRALGLTAADAMLKAHHPVPEIWLAEETAAADTAVRALEAAGLSVVTVSGEELRNLPDPWTVASFSFTTAGLLARVGGTTWTIPYRDRVVGVFCKPRETTGAAVAADSFVDLYHCLDGRQPVHLRFTARETSFDGLGPVTGLSGGGNLIRFVGELENRFSNLWLDRRLVDMRVRHHARGGTTAAGVRRGLSFDTPALNALLASLAPKLARVSDADFSSRLAYLTSVRAPRSMREGDARRSSGTLPVPIEAIGW